MARKKGHEIIPSARRLIGSLRDMGYEFAPAVADLVDNSVEAGATRVDIWIEFGGDESWVRIADNGKGMTGELLREAMRYGSERDYADDDLGKFGLGMKTASMSQCRRLTVASRPKSGGRLSAYSWDLDHIEETDRWEVLHVEKADLADPIAEALEAGNSTVVLWEQLDRILGYQHPYGEFQRKQLARMSREVEEHLAMVFHRFLNGEARRRIKIQLNGNPIVPWDPFCRGERLIRKLHGRSIPVDHNGTSGEVLFEPYVLPHQSRFSSPDAHELASGPRKWNRQQGFYIYRADRLIQSGGWSGLRVQDEHTKLARIALSFDPKLDEAFKINVAKMRVQLPAEMRQDLENLLKPVIRAADGEYRSGGGNNASGRPSGRASGAGASSQSSTLSDNASQSAATDGHSTRTESSQVRLFTRGEVLTQMLSVADSKEKPVLHAVFARLESTPSPI